MPTLVLVESATPSFEPALEYSSPAPHLVVVEDALEDSARAISHQIIHTARELTEQAENAAEDDLLYGTEQASSPLRNFVPQDLSPANIPASFEHFKSRLENAGVEQARRVADCLRATQKAIIQSLAQPCLVLDTEGNLENWNPAFARWLALPEAFTNRALTDFARGDSVRTLLIGLAQLTDAVEASTSPDIAPLTLTGPFAFRSASGSRRTEQITLVPQCRIPGLLESVILLFLPNAS